MELIILGSSGAIPVKNRNLPSIALKFRSDILLFDCGEDVQRRFIDAGLKFNKHLSIFISHFHGDHVIGLPGLLFRFGLSDRTAPVTIIGPRNLYLYLLMHKKIVGLKPQYPIKIIEIDQENSQLLIYNSLDVEKPDEIIKIENHCVYERKRFYVYYTTVNHSVLTFAYVFQEKPRYGRFNPERANELGIPNTNIRKKLQKGEILKFNGKIIDPVKEKIVGAQRPGRKITYSGDLAPPSDSLIELGMNSNLLIHEATFSVELRELAREKLHSTSVDAANTAKKMNANLLVLTHISSRYQEDSSKLLKEAKEIFDNTILAEDLKRIEIK